MATKYTILETAQTEESEPYSRKEYAARDADALAQQYPGTEFAVATSSGKVVHKAKADVPEVDEAVDPAPVDDVPEVQVDAADVDADFDPEDPDNNVDADFEPETDEDAEAPDFNTVLAEVAITAVGGDPAVLHEEDGEEDPGHGLEVVSTEEAVALLAQADADDAEPDQEDGDDSDGDDELDADDHTAVAKLAAAALGTPAPAADPAPAAPAAAPDAATLELCAPNTNAKRMHYRPIGEQRTICGSANTSRRANAHQIETATLCPNCEKLAKGQAVDTRPAGASRGTRKAPKRLVVDAGDIRDLVAHLKQGLPYPMELADGTRIEVVGGDPATKEQDEPEKDNLSDIRSINIVSS